MNKYENKFYSQIFKLSIPNSLVNLCFGRSKINFSLYADARINVKQITAKQNRKRQ